MSCTTYLPVVHADQPILQDFQRVWRGAMDERPSVDPCGRHDTGLARSSRLLRSLNDGPARRESTFGILLQRRPNRRTDNIVSVKVTYGRIQLSRLPHARSSFRASVSILFHLIVVTGFERFHCERGTYNPAYISQVFKQSYTRRHVLINFRISLVSGVVLTFTAAGGFLGLADHVTRGARSLRPADCRPTLDSRSKSSVAWTLVFWIGGINWFQLLHQKQACAMCNH